MAQEHDKAASWLSVLSNIKDFRHDIKRFLDLADRLPEEKTLNALLGKIGTIEKVVDKLPSESTIKELSKGLEILNKLDKKQLSSLIKGLDRLPDGGTITTMLQLFPQILPLLQNLPDAQTLKELLERLKDVERVVAALDSEE